MATASIQMSYMEGIARGLALEMTHHRKYNYSHDPLEEFLRAHPHVGCSTFKVPNSRTQLLDTLLLRARHATTCILYAHGLGSNKLEALGIARTFLREGYDVCGFDFSGSGRSEGHWTSYGLLEQDDVAAVLSALDAEGRYERYVLWGRSMGGVAVMVSQGRQPHSKVECMVVDSAFSSLERVAVELGSKKSLLPEFMVEMLIEPLKKYMREQHPVNPFTLDIISSSTAIDCPLLLIYSKNDSIISYLHSKELAKHCRRNPAEIEIKEDHNMQRSKSTHLRILQFITNAHQQQQNNRRNSKNKARGISVASKDAKPSREPSVRGRQGSLRPASLRAASVRGKEVQMTPVSGKSELNQRSITIKTVGSVNDSFQVGRRLETEASGGKKRAMAISSVCLENVISKQANKENIRPCLNLMRKNRFR